MKRLCMLKALLICILFGITSPSYSYQSPAADKPSWQRLNLWLSSTFLMVVREGQVDWDSCLLTASRSLGVSRLLIVAQGIDDTALIARCQWVDERNAAQGRSLLVRATGKKHLELLLLLGTFYAFQPFHYDHYKDSVEHYLNRAIQEGKTLNEGKLTRQAYCLLTKMYFQANDLKNGGAVFNKLITECKEADDKETEARAYEYRGIFLPASPATAMERIGYLQHAADIYRAANNVEGQINVLTDIGYLLVLAGDLPRAYELFLQAMQLVESIHFPYIQYNTDALAMATLFQGKFGEPLKYSLQGVQAIERTHSTIGRGYFYGRMHLLYNMEGGKEKECDELLTKSIQYFIADKDPALYNMLTVKVANLFARGRGKEALPLVTEIAKKIPPVSFTDLFYYHEALAICYGESKQYELSIMHLDKADSVETKAEAIRGPLRKAGIYCEYGNLFYKQGQYRKSKFYYEKYFATPSPSTHHLAYDLDVWLALIEIDSILHDDAAAVAHYKVYTQLADSNYRVSKVRQAEELKVIYETQEKENQITLLNQQAKLRQANLAQATLVRNVTIIGIIVAFLIAGLLYRDNRRRKKNNILMAHKNKQLQNYLTEKEWLLKEIHHRVKNNLQIVMSLLNSQCAYIDNQPALKAIHDSQHRVHAMALIHQKLYGSDNNSSIDVPVYIRELVDYLADSFDTAQRIRFQLDVDPIEMDVSHTVPLGLILNEAITNSIKYAFPDGRSGIISISLKMSSSNHYTLVITDNGIGIPPGLTTKKTTSLGMSLMQGLSKDLNGHFSIENSNGTVIIIQFVPDQNIKRPAPPEPSPA